MIVLDPWAITLAKNLAVRVSPLVIHSVPNWKSVRIQENVDAATGDTILTALD